MEKTLHNSSTATSEPRHFREKRIALSRLKRRIFKHVWLTRIGIMAGVVLALYLLFLLFSFLISKTPLASYANFLGDFIFASRDKINSIEGRVNILILGKGGMGHEAPDLTDTIIFSSVSLDKPSMVLVSLPRDIWIPAIRAKLNSTYYWGKQKSEGGGLILAKSSVEEIVGVPIQYGVVIDFSAFENLVDVLGGIEVDVERSFVDEKYPIPGRENDDCEGDPEFACRYEKVEFVQGKQVMNGAIALKFVRSRNAEGDEGTDLARAARQQKVIIAVKDKVFDIRTLFSPKKLIRALNVLKNSLETDIDAPALAVLSRRLIFLKGNLVSQVLSEDFLVNPPISPKYDYQYVFIPKGDTWAEVHKYIRSLLFP